MKILIIARCHLQFPMNVSPFVLEQGESLRALGCEIEYFAIKGNYLLAVHALKKKIRSCKTDIVHAHYGLSEVTAGL